MQDICGWRIEKRDKIRYQASSGNIRIQIKLYLPANYRQIVIVRRIPSGFKIVKKGLNYFLTYRGKISRRGVIDVGYDVDVYPIPCFLDPQSNWGRVEEIPESMKRKYMESNMYWPISDERMKEIANEPWFKESRIDVWVKNAIVSLWKKIKNAEPQGERLGALRALKLKRGDCDEFTDLFITLARLRGIPTRRVTGMFISSHVELHAWSEIFIPAGEWVIVDAAMRNHGNYTPNYVILKVEEFNPSLPDYHLSWKGGSLKYEIEKEIHTEKIVCQGGFPPQQGLNQLFRKAYTLTQVPAQVELQLPHHAQRA